MPSLAVSDHFLTHHIVRPRNRYKMTTNADSHTMPTESEGQVTQDEPVTLVLTATSSDSWTEHVNHAQETLLVHDPCPGEMRLQSPVLT